MLEWDKKVILIDDERIRYGSHYTDYLCQLEYDFLKVWGEDRYIESLLKLDHYIVSKPYSIVLGENRVILGNRPSQNFSELMRKFPQFFIDEDEKVTEESESSQEGSSFSSEEDRKEFDDSFYKFCRLMAENSFRFRTTQNLSLNHLLSLCPKKLHSMFSRFEKQYTKYRDQQRSLEQQDFDSARTFFYLMRGVFQRKLSIDASEFELFHLFLSLLSPHYEIDHQALVRDLLPTFTSRGGVYKKTQVKDWIFENQKPWSLELASFEGVIHPEKLALLGGRPEGLPVKVEVEDKSFRSIEIEINLIGDSDLKLGIEGQRIFYTRSDKVGSLYPFWEGRFIENKGTIKFYTRSYKGMKVNFVKDFLLSEIERDLSKITKTNIKKIELNSLHFGNDLCLEEISVSKKKYKQDSPLLAKTAIYDSTAPGQHDRLKNVLYIGPLKKTSFGLFSALMEIKDSPSLY